ncbi:MULTISPECIES: carboxypeptidase-like regulatory domain-containing protein [Mangrovimonas]|uniref:carboxypeptidase-like regulatory domain-containing protein n=1 Tax=Mangrovimonas TaxID=1211036 RepID=UPI001E3A1878|nr:carboxypeptidase-like regulatory domain-containing protein [Mangrovimonas futianensis]
MKSSEVWVMGKIDVIFFIVIFLSANVLFSQEVLLSGRVTSNEDVENIHVINKTSSRFTITNEKGEFQISVKLHDTILLSSLLHHPKEFVVYQKMMEEGIVEVSLTKTTYELNEVVLGKILTGDLGDDVSAVEGEPITARKLGIPSYEGPPLTQSERRLKEATTGGGFVPLNPILNAISGRTKMLKNRIKLERRDDLMYEIRRSLEDKLFEMEDLPEERRNEFFYFCSEDDIFIQRCKVSGDIEILEMLLVKLQEFKKQWQTKTD